MAPPCHWKERCLLPLTRWLIATPSRLTRGSIFTSTWTGWYTGWIWSGGPAREESGRKKEDLITTNRCALSSRLEPRRWAMFRLIDRFPLGETRIASFRAKRRDQNLRRLGWHHCRSGEASC